jgi:hypothetical protein
MNTNSIVSHVESTKQVQSKYKRIYLAKKKKVHHVPEMSDVREIRDEDHSLRDMQWPSFFLEFFFFFFPKLSNFAQPRIFFLQLAHPKHFCWLCPC